jgi:hypothetical protein
LEDGMRMGTAERITEVDENGKMVHINLTGSRWAGDWNMKRRVET